MIEQKFPSLFRGLGTFGDPYTIELQPDCKPQALFTARKVPLTTQRCSRGRAQENGVWWNFQELIRQLHGAQE